MTLDLDDRHAAFIAGMEYESARRFELEVADAVHAALHRQSLEALGMARCLARAKGPAWERMIQECGERDE